MIRRRKTKKIWVGDVEIGGGAPISVQSMVKVDACDIGAVVKQIKGLEKIGCDIIRIAVADIESARNLSEIKKQINIPIVADIHFDYRLAIEAIKYGADKLRINPSNIGGIKKLQKIIEAARKKEIPIRIGINAGSLEKDILKKYNGHPTAEGMVESASRCIETLEKLNFDQIVISLKASDIQLTTKACRLFSKKHHYPLHLGITEAGLPGTGVVKSSIGIGCLLLEGIGDTIRVSLSGDPREEVKTGKEILKHLGLSSGPILISCPTCSRTQYKMLPLVKKTEKYLNTIKQSMKVAVMGCAVNGPGEAREADVGIAGGNGKGVLFIKGKVVKTVQESEIFSELRKAIKALC